MKLTNRMRTGLVTAQGKDTDKNSFLFHGPNGLMMESCAYTQVISTMC